MGQKTGFIDKIKTAFRGKSKFPTNGKHRIIWAFTHAGVDYYKFDNAHGDLPYKRGLEAIIAYRELEMMCSMDFLKKHVAKVNSIMDAPKFDLKSAMTIKKLNVQLGERLTLPFDAGLAFNLAAVVYFDKTENPYEYDEKYAAEKIKRWRAGAGVHDFFMIQPVRELIPFLQNYEGDIRILSETVDAINKIHLAEVSGVS